MIRYPKEVSLHELSVDDHPTVVGKEDELLQGPKVFLLSVLVTITAVWNLLAIYWAYETMGVTSSSQVGGYSFGTVFTTVFYGITTLPINAFCLHYIKKYKPRFRLPIYWIKAWSVFGMIPPFLVYFFTAIVLGVYFF